MIWQYADYKKGYMICHYGTCIRLKVKMWKKKKGHNFTVWDTAVKAKM